MQEERCVWGSAGVWMQGEGHRGVQGVPGVQGVVYSWARS